MAVEFIFPVGLSYAWLSDLSDANLIPDLIWFDLQWYETVFMYIIALSDFLVLSEGQHSAVELFSLLG